MWFIVNVLYKSIHIEKNNEIYLWQESFILIDADDLNEAEEKGRKIACGEEHEYRSAEGDLVRWVFDDILSTYEVMAETLENGIELFSRFLRPHEAESLKMPFED